MTDDIFINMFVPDSLSRINYCENTKLLLICFHKNKQTYFIKCFSIEVINFSNSNSKIYNADSFHRIETQCRHSLFIIIFNNIFSNLGYIL